MTDQRRQLGEYILRHQIGSGGMAEVWMGERIRMGTRKTVAIKLLSPASREKAEYRQMFLAEAKMSMMLNHSSIVQVFDVDECDGECFIAMEWVDGINLAQLNGTLWGRGEALPLHVGVYIVSGVLRALDHAHNLRTEDSASTSIVHRDVSPQNVMLSVGGEVKLMDFGVARFSSEETAGIHVKGKLRYMPAEQLQGHSRDPTVDLFAVGALLHELIEAKRFRNTDDDVEMLAMILGGQTPPLSHPQAVPPPILQVLEGLLAPNPRHRIGSARAALQMLTQWNGYQNAAIELEDYVVRYRELCPSVISSSASSSIDPHDAAQPGRQTTGSSAAIRRGARTNASTSATYEQLDGESVDNTGVSSLQHLPVRSRFNRIAAPSVAAFGLIVGCSSVTVAVYDVTQTTQSSDPGFWAELIELEPPPAIAATEPVVELAPPPVRAPVTAREPEPEPEPELELELELEAEPELQLPPDTQPDTKAKERVKVTFAAGNFRSLDLRVGGRQVTLQPFKTLQIPEGSHTIQIRPMSTKTWIKVGRAKFEAGKRYEVLLAKPANFDVVEVR